MTETTQLIVAAAYGAAFGGGVVVLVGWLTERRRRRETPWPPRFKALGGRWQTEPVFDAPRLSPLWASLGKTAAAFAALGVALFRALAPIVGKMSG